MYLLDSIGSVSTRMVFVSFNSCLLDSILEVRWSIIIEINFNPIWYLLKFVMDIIPYVCLIQ